MTRKSVYFGTAVVHHQLYRDDIENKPNLWIAGSTPASDMHTWSSFTDFMAMDCSGSQLAGGCDMDAGMYTSCNSSDCGSPFTTSNSSLDSMSGGGAGAGASLGRKQRKLETNAGTTTSHKRSLSSSNGMGLKEMLCSATTGRNDKFTGEVTQQAKRMRSDDRMVASPQLLQQLMAPTKTHNAMGKPKAGSRKGPEVVEAAKAEKMVCSRSENVDEENRGQATVPSNSVLMNLLVSGCDVSAGYVCMAPMRPRKTAKV